MFRILNGQATEFSIGLSLNLPETGIGMGSYIIKIQSKNV